RPTYGIVPLANELCMDQYEGYILSYNGGEIIDWTSKEILYEKKIDSNLLPYLYVQSKEADVTILTYDGPEIITEHSTNLYVEKEAFLNKMQIRAVPSFLDAIQHPVAKCLIVGEPEKLEALELTLQAALKGQMGVFRSEPFFLELVPLGIDKTESLKVLLQKLNIQREELIACGDGFNDLSMIQYAGLGVAMHNAQPLVKKVADYIAPSNDNDGVAHVVERFLLA
ncbi:MAG: Cof-type HAD-IIB family hydrolase, partial [Bacteroidaceae bacterium]